METNSNKLFKGFIASIFSVAMLFMIIVMVAMSPDPNNEINYTLILITIGILIMIFGYGIVKIDMVHKFLIGKEKNNEMLDEPEN